MTPWDLQFLLLDTMQKGFLFHKPKQENNNILKSSSLIDHLKESLSRTLNFFPPLVGHLTTENMDDDTVSSFINCNNTGAEFTHACAPKLTVSAIFDYTQLVDVFLIGCTMSHNLGYGTCFWHFFNSWSEISRGCKIISKILVFERNFLEEMKIPIHLPLKLDDRNCLKNLNVKSISSLQSFVAQLWRSVTRCRKLDDDKEFFINIIIGCARTRLNPPLPEGYFGNAFHYKKVKKRAGELLKYGLGWAAMQINKMVVAQNSEEVVKMYQDWAENPILITKNSVFRMKNILDWE
ncbi:hypothetical protein P3L10_003731 [Capsicum annuum]